MIVRLQHGLFAALLAGCTDCSAWSYPEKWLKLSRRDAAHDLIHISTPQWHLLVLFSSSISTSIASTLGRGRLNGLVEMSNAQAAPLIPRDFFVSETLGAGP